MSEDVTASFPILHLFAHGLWHDPAAIVGNRKALLALREAIDKALSGAEAKTDVFENDGEGYTVTVLARDNMAGVPNGYVSEPACDESFLEWLEILS